MSRSRSSWRGSAARTWRRTGPNGRLVIGVLIVITIWWIGLDTVSVAGITVPWPLGLLVAAMGWARVGLSMRPMITLVVLSFLFDLSANAPFGSYAIVALATYGVHAAAESALDLENDPLAKSLLPFVSLLAGLMVLWVLASSSAGYVARLTPLLLTGIATALAYGALSHVFHLRARPGVRAGRA